MAEPDSKVGVGADLNYLIHYNIIKVDHIQTPLCGEGEVIQVPQSGTEGQNISMCFGSTHLLNDP